MRAIAFALLLGLSTSALCAAPAAAPAPADVTHVPPQHMDHGRFKDVRVFRPVGTPTSFALLLSGDGRWESDMDFMAHTLIREGALVAGIDTRQFMEELEKDGGDCTFPEGDLENLARYVQAWAQVPGYLRPVIVGYSSGSTLMYAVLSQSAPDTFAAGLGMGFCPDLDLVKPICPGHGPLRSKLRPDGKNVDFQPTPRLAVPFVALLGKNDPICHATPTQAFIDQMPTARQVLLPGIDHHYSRWGHGRAALAAAYRKLVPGAAAVAAPASADLGDLPVIEEPVDGAGNGPFAVLWSGDGGWAGLDKEVADALQARGIPVVGVDSLRYFWKARTPEGIGADLDRIVRHYSSAWNRREVILIGYSQGADVLPFAINRLPAATRKQVRLAAAMGLSDHAVFEFKLSNWVADNNDGPQTLPEVRKLAVPFLCIYGADEDDTICPKLAGGTAKVTKLPGGHHFDGDYPKLASTILDALPN